MPLDLQTSEQLKKLSKTAVLIMMFGFFLAFGVISNFFDDEGMLYNLFQGIFISLFTGGMLILAKYLVTRKKNSALCCDTLTG